MMNLIRQTILMKSIKLINISHEFEIMDVESIIFDIYVPEMDRVVGRCEYREETGQDLWYYGHIGYVIYPPYRGENFAYRACMKMFDLLGKEQGLHEFVITCNPDNIASKKTILKMKGEFLKLVDVDKEHELYKLGDHQKEIYIVKANG